MKAATVSTSRLWSVAMGTCLIAAAGAAPAQAPSSSHGAPPAGAEVAPAEGLEDLIRALDSEQWAQRQQAEDALRAALSDLATLESALASIDFEVSCEARRRLTTLGEEVFQRSPRPGVGISFTPDSAGDGVRIDSTVSGFDADEHLKRGDVILSFGGIRTPDDETMRAAIMVHDPEEVVPITLRRDNEIVEIQLRLGWFRDLTPGSARQPDRGAMRRAWAMRAARHLEANHPHELAADADLAPALWHGADAVTTQARARLEQQRRPTAVMIPQVTIAGALTDDEQLVRAGRRDGAAERRRLIVQEMDSLNQRISSLEASLQRLDGEDDQRAGAIRQQIEQLRAQRQQYEAWLELDRP